VLDLLLRAKDLFVTAISVSSAACVVGNPTSITGEDDDARPTSKHWEEIQPVQP